MKKEQHHLRLPTTLYKKHKTIFENNKSVSYVCNALLNHYNFGEILIILDKENYKKRKLQPVQKIKLTISKKLIKKHNFILKNTKYSFSAIFKNIFSFLGEEELLQIVENQRIEK